MSSNDDISYSDTTCGICGSYLQKKFNLTICDSFKLLTAWCLTCNKYVPFNKNTVIKVEINKDSVIKLKVKECDS